MPRELSHLEYRTVGNPVLMSRPILNPYYFYREAVWDILLWVGFATHSKPPVCFAIETGNRDFISINLQQV